MILKVYLKNKMENLRKRSREIYNSNFVPIRPKRTKTSLGKVDILGELFMELRKYNNRLENIEQKQENIDSKLDKILGFLGITESNGNAFSEECNYYA